MMGLNLDTKFNYVFLNVCDDFLEPVFMPLKKYENIKVFKSAFDANPLVKKLLFVHWSNKINKKFKLPLKSIWFKRIGKDYFCNGKPTCFIFMGGKYLFDDHRLFDYIKNQNPENKIVVYFGDLISKRNFDIKKIKTFSDEIITYDKAEAEEYDIKYHGNSLGYGAVIEITEPTDFENDVYFIGFAKDRLDTIHNVYNKLSLNGLKCNFIICGTKPEERIDAKGLHYCDPIPYLENLYNVNKSKCVLDIIQGNSTGITLRVKESQVYKRKLLTNNALLIEQDFYDEKNMSTFKSADDIDIDFIKKDINYRSFKENPYSTENFIYYLESVLQGGNNE